MVGAFNRYRAAALDAAADADIIGATVAQPSCFIGGELDPVRSMLPGTDLFAEPGAGVHRLPRRHDRRRRRPLGPPGGRRRDQRRARRVPGLARMTDHRARYGPHNPDDTYVGHEFAEHLADLGEVQMNYATARRRGGTGPPADPRSDPVVVELRSRDASAGRALRGLRRGPSGPGEEHPHARPLHARQHGQRPGPLHRPGHRTAHDRERPVLGRCALRVDVGVRRAWAGRRGAATRIRRCSPPRCTPRSGRASASASVRCSTSGAPISATSGRSGRGTP